MSKLVRNKRGIWEIRYTVDRRSKRYSTRTRDKRAALIEQARFDAALNRPPEPEQQTTGGLLDAYMEDRREHVKALDAMTTSIWRLKDYFGHAQPRHITVPMVKGFATFTQKQGVQPSSVRRYLGVLRTALNWGVKNGWIDHAPHVPLPSMGPARERWLTKAEADRLIAGAAAPHVRLFILLGLHTGARKTAILELTWDRVDLDQGLVWYPMPGRTYTKKRRVIVPINSVLRKALEDARDLAQTDWVIEFNSRPVGCIQAGFKRACNRAGLDDVRIHDLRRTCASWLVQAGVSFSETAAYLGDTEAMIRKHYGHFSPDWLRGAAEALER